MLKREFIKIRMCMALRYGELMGQGFGNRDVSRKKRWFHALTVAVNDLKRAVLQVNAVLLM